MKSPAKCFLQTLQKGYTTSMNYQKSYQFDMFYDKVLDF
jgi:hypothetical protein